MREGDAAIVAAAMAAAQAGFAGLECDAGRATRAARSSAPAICSKPTAARLIALLQSEGGKTLDDASSEVREAVDFCRYYAAQARRALAPQPMPGPTGESNELRYRGRGVFVCISPWNFPLAIFIGQVAGRARRRQRRGGQAGRADAADRRRGGAAAARRPACRQAALHLVPGDGKVGARAGRRSRASPASPSPARPRSARAINRALAAKDGPIVPLIAETGGINAMIVDATALPEQVTDDVIASAFRSAGQRCSALRLLCVQEDVADRVLEMIAGAARELTLGDPREPRPMSGR